MVFLVLHWLLSKKGTKANKFEHEQCDYPSSLSFPHSVSNYSNLLFSGQNLSVLINVHPRDHFPTKLQTFRSHRLSSPEAPWSLLTCHRAGNACPHIPFISGIKTHHFSAPQHSLFSYFEQTRIHTITIIHLSPKLCWDSWGSRKMMKIAYSSVLKASEKGLNSSIMPKFKQGLRVKSISCKT